MDPSVFKTLIGKRHFCLWQEVIDEESVLENSVFPMQFAFICRKEIHGKKYYFETAIKHDFSWVLCLSLPARWHFTQMITFHLVRRERERERNERTWYNCILYPWVLTVSVSIEISILWLCMRQKEWYNGKTCCIAEEWTNTGFVLVWVLFTHKNPYILLLNAWL